MTDMMPPPERTELTAPYWEGLEGGQLRFQRCAGCGNAWLPARSECPRCWSDKWAWEAAGGRGKLISWVVYHRAYHPAFKDRLPYNVAVVELAEGPRLITNITGVRAGEGLRADMPVELRVERDNDVPLARFAVSEQDGEGGMR